MKDLTGLDGANLVAHMTPSEVAIVHAASKIIHRVFDIKSIDNRLEDKLSSTAMYSCVRKMHEIGVFSTISKNIDQTLGISFTAKGRSICSFISIKHIENTTGVSNVQSQLI